MDDVELLEEIEKTFSIEITDAEAKHMISVGDLETLIGSKINDDTSGEVRWDLICRIVRLQSGHKGPIDRNTTFFAVHASEGISHG